MVAAQVSVPKGTDDYCLILAYFAQTRAYKWITT